MDADLWIWPKVTARNENAGNTALLFVKVVTTDPPSMTRLGYNAACQSDGSDLVT